MKSRSEVEEHSASVVIKWLRACNTLKQLQCLWGVELTDYSKRLHGVIAEKDKRKGELK